jgi:hypothetical protein
VPAEIFPDEGLTYILNVFPRQTQALPGSLYAGFFSSQTATTVPARTAVLAGQTGVTELTATGGYGRTQNTTALGPAPASSGSGMRTTIAANGVVFDESTATWSVATVNGFFVTPGSALNTGPALFYSNFSDDTAITINAAGFTVRISIFYHLDG